MTEVWNPLSIPDWTKQARSHTQDTNLQNRTYTNYNVRIKHMGNRCDHPHTLGVPKNWMLQMTLNAPWFVRNTTLHEDARVEFLMDFIRRIAT
ncbi:hypothetical protein Trydic_g3210 [Trypoxylus dichotomus]